MDGLYIREINVHTKWGDEYPRTEILLEALDPAIGAMLMGAFRGNSYPTMVNFTSREQEYTCIWCGSANPISNRHCSQCGGHRGAIMTRM